MNDSTIKTKNDGPAAMQPLPPRTKEDGVKIDGKTTAAARAQAAGPSASKAGIPKSPHAPSASLRSAVSGLPNAKLNLEKTVPNRLPAEPDSTASAPQLATSANSAIPIQVPARPIRPGFAAPFQADAPVAPPVETDAAVNTPAAAIERPTAPEPERRINVNDRNPPRIPSKAENFVAGDHVVYPTHGVGKVEKIAIEEIAGQSLELIHITFEENRMTLRVPVSKARSAGLRKLATRQMFDEALALLKGRARIKRTMWSRRAQEYEAKINSGDPLSIAEVVRDLHRNAGQPDQSFSERQIYEAAMDRLAAELGALDKTDKATAVAKLGNFLKTVV